MAESTVSETQIETFEPLPILYQDDHLIAINKPPKLLVHRTKISEDTEFVVQRLRDQIGQYVYPIHRLDRATSGVLLLAKSKPVLAELSKQFAEKTVEKRYLAIVRGYVAAEATIDYPLKTQRARRERSAVTHYRRLAQIELPIAIGYRYPTARFSLVEARPETGRTHQIRRHFAHLRHPIIGDRPYGDIKQNHYFRDHWQIERLLLHAHSLRFFHPVEKRELSVVASLDDLFKSALSRLSFLEAYAQYRLPKL